MKIARVFPRRTSATHASDGRDTMTESAPWLSHEALVGVG